MKIPFSIVVAVDQKFGIGQNGVLPWHLPGDMKYFKEVTVKDSSRSRQNVVIMGRKTWESIPDKFRPLPGRVNIVLTRDKNSVLPAGIFKVSDFEESLDFAVDIKAGQVFVIGGAEIFKIAIEHPCCQKLFITHIQKSFQCDRFFPPLPPGFKEISRSGILQDGEIEYFFSVYQREKTP